METDDKEKLNDDDGKKLKVFLECIEDDDEYYPELRNYAGYKKLLTDKIDKSEDSYLSRIILQLINSQPNRSKVDIACTLAGATNYLAYREACQKSGAEEYRDKSHEDLEKEAREAAKGIFWDDAGKKLDDFVKKFYHELFDLCLSRTNCPTIPQRAFPLATFLPKKGTVGVLELGCSRGDLGLALLNPGRVLRPQDEGKEGKQEEGKEREPFSPYLFSKPEENGVKTYRQFGGESTLESHNKDSNKSDTLNNEAPNKSEKIKFSKRSWRDVLRRSRPIDRYFGVDFLEKKQTEPGWLLALWGLLDPRREVLARFYNDFKLEECGFFKRVVADALEVEQYLDDALDFMAGVDKLVLFTSYMIYQIDLPQRFLLVDVARRIKTAFETRFPGKKFYWFNQGNSVKDFFTQRELDFNEIYFSELNFNEANRLYGRDLALLADDCNSNWRTPNILVLYGGPSRESLISVKSANTVVENLNEFGFSCSTLEIPQDVYDESSRVDERLNLTSEVISKTDKVERANVRVNALLKEYEEKNGKPDLVFPYLHGVYGEDGKIQKVLEETGWEYVGCDSVASELGMDKNRSKEIWNAQTPSREYWVEQENDKLLTTFDWDERLRQNPLWLFDRIKIEYDGDKDGGVPWRVVKDESVDFSKASDEEKDVFAKRVFNVDSYKNINEAEWSKKLGELVDVMLRRWEYDVFIYEANWNSDPEKNVFENAREGVENFLKDKRYQGKTFIVERRYKAPVMTAPWILVEKGNCVCKIKEQIESFNKGKDDQLKLRGACILKPYDEGSSFNVETVDPSDLTSEELASATFEKLKNLKDDGHERWILEKRLNGIDVTVSVLGSGDDLIVLPPLQIRPRNDIYDYEAKYFQEDSTYLFRMFPIQSAYLETAKNVAAKAYRMLGCRDFARIDLLMVDDEKDKSKKRFYVLEANTMPGATVHSLTPKSAMEAGFSLPEFFRYVVDKAFYRYGSRYATKEIPEQDLPEKKVKQPDTGSASI